MVDGFPSGLHREVLFARMEATRQHAADVRPGHLLLGLIMSPRTLVGRMLKGITIEQARAALSRVTPHDSVAERQDIPQSAETEQILRQAAEEAGALGQTLTAEHLLLALFGDETCARVLALAGLSEVALRESLAVRAHAPVRFDAGTSPDPSLVLA